MDRRLDQSPSARFVLILGALIALGPLTIDTYLPALPSIEADFATSSAAVQLTITGTLVGLALGQLLIGPISDAVGRRAPLIAGIGVHVLASLLCVVAPNIEALGAARVLQGLGAAASSVVTMAVVRDVSSGVGAARLLSRLMLVMGVAPVLAPTLGSQILRFTQWRGVFLALALLGVALAVVAVTLLPETLPADRRAHGGVVSTTRTYAGLLTDRVFVGLVVVNGLAMGALLAYVAGSSFVFQQEYGLSQQQFGFAFGAGSIALIAATQLNGYLLRRWSPRRLLSVAVVIGLGSALLMVAVALSGSGGLLALLAPMWGVLASAGLIMPNAPAVALSRHGEAAGAAAAVLGAVQFVFGAATAPLVGVLGVDAVAMAAVITGCMVVAVVVLAAAVRPWTAVVDAEPVPQPVMA